MRLVALEVDKSDFGIYLFAISILAYFGLSQLGLDLASAQRIAEALAREDEEEANRIYGQLKRFNWCLCVILLTVIGVMIAIAAILSQPPLVCWIILLVGISMAVKLLTNPAIAALNGSQNIHFVGMNKLFSALCAIFLAYGLLRGGAGILCLPAAQAIASIAGFLILHALRRRYCKWSTRSVIDLWRGFTPLFRYAIGVAIVGGVAMLDASSEPIIFKLVSGAPFEHIATYNIWYRFPALSLVVAVALLNNAGPVLAMKIEKNREAGLKFHQKLLWLTSGIGASATVGLAIWLTPFVHHWLSGTYDIANGRYTASAMAAAIGFRAFMTSLACTFYPLNRVRIVIAGFSIMACSKIGLAFIFVPFSPIAGMAVANAIAAAFTGAFFGYMLYKVADYPVHTLISTFAIICLAVPLGILCSGPTIDASIRFMAYGIMITLFALGICYIVLVKRLGLMPSRIPGLGGN